MAKAENDRVLEKLAAQQRARKGKATDDEAKAWQAEIALLAPIESITEVIEGQSLEFRCPKTAKWLAALPHLQEAYEVGRKAMPNGQPMEMLAMALASWDAPRMMMGCGDAICKILDVFLGKELGYVAENFTPDSIVRMVRNFIRVIPVRAIQSFFRQAVAAGQAQQRAATAPETAKKGGA